MSRNEPILFSNNLDGAKWAHFDIFDASKNLQTLGVVHLTAGNLKIFSNEIHQSAIIGLRFLTEPATTSTKDIVCITCDKNIYIADTTNKDHLAILQNVTSRDRITIAFRDAIFDLHKLSKLGINVTADFIDIVALYAHSELDKFMSTEKVGLPFERGSGTVHQSAKIKHLNTYEMCHKYLNIDIQPPTESLNIDPKLDESAKQFIRSQACGIRLLAIRLIQEQQIRFDQVCRDIFLFGIKSRGEVLKQYLQTTDQSYKDLKSYMKLLPS